MATCDATASSVSPMSSLKRPFVAPACAHHAERAVLMNQRAETAFRGGAGPDDRIEIVGIADKAPPAAAEHLSDDRPFNRHARAFPERSAAFGKIECQHRHLSGFEIRDRDHHEIAAQRLPQNLCDGAQQCPRFKLRGDCVVDGENQFRASQSLA